MNLFDLEWQEHCSELNQYALNNTVVKTLYDLGRVSRGHMSLIRILIMMVKTLAMMNAKYAKQLSDAYWRALPRQCIIKQEYDRKVTDDRDLDQDGASGEDK